MASPNKRRTGDNQRQGQRFTSQEERKAAATLPRLSQTERKQVHSRVAISAAVVHETVREEGERELARSVPALAWSGLAAGLSMGFSLVGQGLIVAYLPAVAWRPLISSFGYSLGFVIVVLGRQQLYTENTLTAVLPLLAHPTRRTWLRVGRLWGIVLLANLVGGFIFATIVAQTNIFPSQITSALVSVAVDQMRGEFGLVVLRGMFAGWLVALMVWLLPGAETQRLWVIMLLSYFIALGGFAHIIAGSIDVLYLVSRGNVGWGSFLWQFLTPTLLGNIIGGVSLVAALNYAQVAAERFAPNDARSGKTQ